MCYDNSITEMSLLQKRENIKKAENKGGFVLDGKNKDDEKVYRPGLKACEELGIISPLANNDLAKREI